MSEHGGLSSHRTVFKGFSASRSPSTLFANLCLEVSVKRPNCYDGDFVAKSPADLSAGKSPKATSSKIGPALQALPSEEPRSSTYSPKFESSALVLHSKFELLERLGSGSFSRVYKAVDRQDGQLKAVKVLPLSKAVENYTEAEILKSLSSNNINVPTYFDSWIEDRKLIIVMELCEQTLNQKLSPNLEGCQPLGEEETYKLISHIVPAIRKLHDMGYAHMDIKPDNILIARGRRRPLPQPEPCENNHRSAQSTGNNIFPGIKSPLAEESTYLLSDFGISTLHSDNSNYFSIAEGDHAYMPLETLANNTDRASLQLQKIDIFSLGLILLQCVTGVAVPKNGHAWHDIRRPCFIRSILAPLQISSCLKETIARCLDADPSRRPTTTEILVGTILRRDSIERGILKRQNLQLNDKLKALTVFSLSDRKRTSLFENS